MSVSGSMGMRRYRIIARLSGREISLIRAMVTFPVRWDMIRLRAIADAIASGSALITMSQSSLRLNNSSNCVRRELSLRVDDMMTPFRFLCEVRLAPSANFFQ